MILNEFQSIVNEYFDVVHDDATRKCIVALEDSEQSQLLSALASALYDKVVGKVDEIDFGTIPKSRGDITKVDGYENTVECLNIMKRLVIEYKQDPTVVDNVLQAIENVKANKVVFMKAYEKNIELPMVLYNLIVLSIEQSVSFLITVCIQYVKDPEEKDIQAAIDRVAYNNVKSNLIYQQVCDFNEAVNNKEFDKSMRAILNTADVREGAEVHDFSKEDIIKAKNVCLDKISKFIKDDPDLTLVSDNKIYIQTNGFFKDKPIITIAKVKKDKFAEWDRNIENKKDKYYISNFKKILSGTKEYKSIFSDVISGYSTKGAYKEYYLVVKRKIYDQVTESIEQRLEMPKEYPCDVDLNAKKIVIKVVKAEDDVEMNADKAHEDECGDSPFAEPKYVDEPEGMPMEEAPDVPEQEEVPIEEPKDVPDPEADIVHDEEEPEVEIQPEPTNGADSIVPYQEPVNDTVEVQNEVGPLAALAPFAISAFVLTSPWWIIKLLIPLLRHIAYSLANLKLKFADTLETQGQFIEMNAYKLQMQDMSGEGMSDQEKAKIVAKQQKIANKLKTWGNKIAMDHKTSEKKAVSDIKTDAQKIKIGDIKDELPKDIYSKSVLF